MNVEHSGDPYIKNSMREFGETIFAEMSALAVKTGSINLGPVSYTHLTLPTKRIV